VVGEAGERQDLILPATRELAIDPDAQELERQRLSSIYAEEITRLVALARLLTGDAAAGEDLAHEVFLQATRKSQERPGYLREPAWPWLRMTLVRAVGHRRRRALHEMRSLIRAYQKPPDGMMVDSAIDFVAALQRLPPRMRACAALFYGEDLSVGQVAEALGCSPRTVETQLRAARGRLRALLEDEPSSAPE
jgi:RNA polymerase sigma factor (sigma-70 family)